MFRLRDFLQPVPELVFEADTGLASADHNGSFDDHGFHRCALTGCQVKTIRYFGGK